MSIPQHVLDGLFGDSPTKGAFECQTCPRKADSMRSCEGCGAWVCAHCSARVTLPDPADGEADAIIRYHCKECA